MGNAWTKIAIQTIDPTNGTRTEHSPKGMSLFDWLMCFVFMGIYPFGYFETTVYFSWNFGIPKTVCMLFDAMGVTIMFGIVYTLQNRMFFISDEAWSRSKVIIGFFLMGFRNFVGANSALVLADPANLGSALTNALYSFCVVASAVLNWWMSWTVLTTVNTVGLTIMTFGLILLMWEKVWAALYDPPQEGAASKFVQLILACNVVLGTMAGGFVYYIFGGDVYQKVVTNEDGEQIVQTKYACAPSANDGRYCVNGALWRMMEGLCTFVGVCAKIVYEIWSGMHEFADVLLFLKIMVFPNPADINTPAYSVWKKRQREAGTTDWRCVWWFHLPCVILSASSAFMYRTAANMLYLNVGSGISEVYARAASIIHVLFSAFNGQAPSASQWLGYAVLYAGLVVNRSDELFR